MHSFSSLGAPAAHRIGSSAVTSIVHPACPHPQFSHIPLNPHAILFSSSRKVNIRNRAVAAVFFTILILSSIMLNTFNTNLCKDVHITYTYGLNPNARCFNLESNEIAPVFSNTESPTIHTLMNNSENTVEHPNIKISHDPYSILKDIRLKNVNRIIIGHLNINSVRNKFEMVSDLIRGSIDIFLISETKIDSTFPTSQFKVYGYSLPYRLDRSQNGGGLLLYVREDIPSKLLQPKSLSNIECIRIEISIAKRKWLLLGLYNPMRNHCQTK